MPILLCSASYDASVRIWDMEQSTCLHILTHHCEPVTSISFHPSGQYLVSGSHEGLFNLWSLKVCQWIDIFYIVAFFA